MKSRVMRVASVMVVMLAVFCFLTSYSEGGDDAGGKDKAIKAEKTQRVIITFKNKPGIKEKALVKSCGGKVKRSCHLVPIIAATVSEEGIKALKKNPWVKSVTTDVKVKAIEKNMLAIHIIVYGDRSLSRRDYETYPGIRSRVETAVWSMWRATSAPTQTNIDGLKIAQEEYEPVKASLKAEIAAVNKLEAEMDKYKAPYTPGRKIEKKY